MMGVALVCKCCGFEGDFTAFCMSDPDRVVSEFRPSSELPAPEWRCPRCRLHVRQKTTKKWDGTRTKELIILRAGAIPEAA